MGKLIIILTALMLVVLFSSSCQKAKGPEGKKEVQVQREEGKQQTPVAQKKNEELKAELKKSPLTEDEQNEFEKIGGGGIPSPNLFKSKSDALRYLKILLKGDVKTIRWYINYAQDEDVVKGKYKKPSRQYGDDICNAIDAIALKREEAFDLVVEVIKKKADYPTAYACACKAIGWYITKEGRNDKVIPLLVEALKSSDSHVRLESAGALLASGEGDIALPVLNELTKQGEVEALVKLYEPEDRKTGVIHWTKLWDKRGLEIITRALDYPSDEIKAWAAEALAYLGIEETKSEAVALKILHKYIDRTESDYGIGRQEIPGETYTKEFLLPGYESKDIGKLEEQKRRDRWACRRAISTVGKLKSKAAVPLLIKIKDHNKGVEFICWENLADKAAENALHGILGSGQ